MSAHGLIHLEEDVVSRDCRTQGPLTRVYRCILEQFKWRLSSCLSRSANDRQQLSAPSPMQAAGGIIPFHASICLKLLLGIAYLGSVPVCDCIHPKESCVMLVCVEGHEGICQLVGGNLLGQQAASMLANSVVLVPTTCRETGKEQKG